MIDSDENGNCGQCGGALTVEPEMEPNSLVYCTACCISHGPWAEFQRNAIWQENETGDTRLAEAVVHIMHRGYAHKADAHA